MSGFFHLFVYGTLQTGGPANDLLERAERISGGTVGGVVYDIDGQYPALVLYGRSPVGGEIWRCPVQLLKSLDEYEATTSGLFRRIGVEVRADDDSLVPCWVYVAGPRLARQLTPARRK